MIHEYMCAVVVALHRVFNAWWSEVTAILLVLEKLSNAPVHT